MGSFWDEFKAWGRQPFSVDMSAVHWFYFLGFLICLMILWRIILAHIFEGVSR